MKYELKKLENEVSTWAHVSVHSHRFGGREFLFGKAEVGHVHTGGSSTYPSHVQCVMHCWRTVSLRSITRFRTQVGSYFICKVKKTLRMPSS
jgi:hypothetical protein